MSYRQCKACGSLEWDCECREPDIREHHSNGDEVKRRTFNGNDVDDDDDDDKGGFLGTGFKYVAGDPFW